nr:hypothetical protein [Bdellovibrionales bacterium]
MKSIKGLLALILSFEVALAPTTLYAQSSKAPLPETITREQAQLAYWAGLDLNQPHVADFALGDTEKDKPLWVVNDDSALLDEDPFFMRAQVWEPAAKIEDCADQICFRKDKDGLVLGNSNFEKTLRLQERFTPVLETEEYLILAADDDRIFREKNPGTADPGEGVFFLHKRDLVTGAATGFPVPIFFFPLPDAGWTGNNGGAFEFAAVDQFVLTDKSGFAFPIDRRDFLEVENSGRRNLILAQAYSFLEGRIRADGVAFPRPNSTILFGTLPSGIMPKPRAGLTGRIDVEKIRRIGNELNPLASAHAEMSEATRLQILREEIERQASGRSALRKWISPIVLYGGTFLAAAGLYSSYPIDWSAMITDDMPAKLTKLAGVLAVVTAVSVGLRVTLHKAQLDKKYAHAKTTLQKVDFYHRSLLDELVHGLYTSFAMIGQTLRHIMEFTKDRTLPSSHLLHKAWDETMGFQMKQNSHLAMNWKTFYLGALWFGMADTFLVAVDLLIFTPAIIDYFSLGMATTAAAASFASAEVLRNFLGYIQTGAHGYSAEVKFIHLSAATEEAKRQLLLMHKNPEAKENEVELQELTENNLARRYKAVGLPDQDEFLYDPLSILEWITKTAGFGIDGKLSPGQRELLKEHRFVMARRRFGFSQPSLKRAVKMAERILRQAPSPVGARVVQTLKWAAKDRSAVKATLGHNMDLLATGKFMDYPKSLYGDVTAALAEDDLTN